MVKMVHFSIDGEWFTELLRSLWSEHSEIKAINIWNASFPEYSSKEGLINFFIPVVSGKKQFKGLNELELVCDNIKEVHGMPLFDCIEDVLKYHHAKLVLAELEYTYTKLNVRFESVYSNDTNKQVAYKINEYEKIHNNIMNICELFELSKLVYTNTNFLNRGSFIEKRGIFREWYESINQYFRNKYGHNVLKDGMSYYDAFFYKEKAAIDREEKEDIYKSFLRPKKPKFKTEDCNKTEFTSGWMSKEGLFYGCGDFNHVNFTEDLCNKLSIEIPDDKGDQETLEDLGYIKVSMRRFYWDDCNHVASQEQIASIKKLINNWGIEVTQFNNCVSSLKEAIDENKQKYRIYKRR